MSRNLSADVSGRKVTGWEERKKEDRKREKKTNVSSDSGVDEKDIENDTKQDIVNGADEMNEY